MGIIINYNIKMKISLIVLSALALTSVEAIRLTAEPGVAAKPTVVEKKEDKKELPKDAKPAEKDAAKVVEIKAKADEIGPKSAAIIADSYHPYHLPYNEHAQPALSDQVGGPINSVPGFTISTANPNSSPYADGNMTSANSSIKPEDSPEYPGVLANA